MKLSLTFILCVLIIFVSSCATTALDKKNFEDDEKSKDFILNQINRSSNEGIINIISKLYKLEKLNASEKDLLVMSLKNGDIKKSYSNEIEKLFKHSQKIYSSGLKLSIRTSEKNKEMLVQSLLQENILFNISFSENDFFEINDDVFKSNLKFYCKSFIEEQNNKLADKLLGEEKILIVYSSDYEEDVNALKLNNSDHIFLEISDKNYENKIQNTLEIFDSSNKAELISSFDRNLKIEHAPRLRQDLKKIYFLVGYNEGKSVVPFVKSFSTDLQLFSSTVIFHEADNLNDLADFENISIPVSKNFISKAGNNDFDNLKEKFESLLLDDYINIEKAHQNNVFNSKIILNTGLTQINRGACVNRNLSFWNIDINSIADQS